MAGRYWIETLGCPKNQVDSDKLAGTLVAEGLGVADGPEAADVVVVNTCAFIEAARQESIDTILELDDRRPEGSRLVVTGCMAERYADELAAALPEVDAVAPFGVALLEGAPGPVGAGPGVPVTLTAKPGAGPVPEFDLLELPRPPSGSPWAYVKVAEGCDRRCGFCAIPSFRGRQRSRSLEAVLAEVDALAGDGSRLREVVLVAQDLASYGLDRTDRRQRDPDDPVTGRRPLVDLVEAVSTRVARTRLLYLYPSALDDALVEAVLNTGVPYFDLSLQHVSRPLLRAMRRWGEGQRFLDRIAAIRRAEPDAAFRSSFIVGYPGETEADHDLLLAWLEEAQLDWAGFFPFSDEAGTHAAGLSGKIPDELVVERLRECSELQDTITARRRDALIGSVLDVLVDRPGVARGVREAPEIDGIVAVPSDLVPGTLVPVRVVGAEGPDLVAEPLDGALVGGSVGRDVRGRGPGSAVSAEALDHPGLPGPVGGEPAPTTTFGPSALLTPANGITILRLAATPVLIILIMLWGASWFTFAFGGVLALSDGVDGWLARRQGTTRSGAFLDPLADKFAVLGAMVALVAKGIVWWLPVALIAVREIAMSVYRSVVGRHGVSIPARPSAKVKTLVQDLAIGLCLAPPLAGHTTLLNAGLWVAAALTVVTGIQYAVDGRAAARARRA